jgi:hypothetical protein
MNTKQMYPLKSFAPELRGILDVLFENEEQLSDCYYCYMPYGDDDTQAQFLTELAEKLRAAALSAEQSEISH